MSAQPFVNGAAQAAGNQIMNAALNTPQGHAGVVTAAAVVVAAAPIALAAALVGGTLWAAVKVADWLDF